MSPGSSWRIEGAARRPDAPISLRAALTKAITWFDAAKTSGIHQEKALRVLIGVRSARPRETMQSTIDELLALQRTDGGWSQTVPELKSDAFATGQTLYVLSLAGYTAKRPEIKRAIDFLVATQSPDGSWPMISRSTPDGSPGSAKLIDADHLHRRLLGHAWPCAAGAQAYWTRRVRTAVVPEFRGGPRILRSITRRTR